MKITILRWSSVIAATLSATWIFLLTALVLRCSLAGGPFPALAKFAPFSEHLVATGRMLILFPILALLAVVFMGLAWYSERSFRSNYKIAIICTVLVSMSPVFVALNPGGYFSWFLS
jgi:hypothetical protein